MLGTNVNTVTNWEVGRTSPALRFMPAIVGFLGYVPFSAAADGLLLSERLKTFRKLSGLSQRRLAALLRIDPSTVWHWEQRNSHPSPENAERIAEADPGQRARNSR